MKYTTLLLLCMLWAGMAQGQNWLDSLKFYPQNADGIIEYKDMVEIQGVSKIDLYKRCKAWFGKTYKSATDVIKSESEDMVVGKGAFEMIVKVKVLGMEDFLEYTCFYTLTVEFKDGKYRAAAQPNTLKSYGQYGGEYTVRNPEKSEYAKLGKNAQRKSILIHNQEVKQMNEYFEGLFLSLKKGMTEAKKDDW